MKSWEYKAYTLENDEISFKDKEEINMLGRYGWELVTSIQEKKGTVYKTSLLFKKQI